MLFCKENVVCIFEVRCVVCVFKHCHFIQDTLKATQDVTVTNNKIYVQRKQYCLSCCDIITKR